MTTFADSASLRQSGAAGGAGRALRISKPFKERRMAVQFRTMGCMWSIILSIVLTLIVNLALRGCSGGMSHW